MSDRSPARSDVALGVACAVSGLAAGVAWRVLAPVAADRSSAAESAAAVDLTLLLVQSSVGLVVAFAVVLRPGEVPARRAGAAIVGLVVGGGIAWGTGLLLGISSLGAVGAAFVAAPLTAIVVFLATLMEYLRRGPDPLPQYLAPLDPTSLDPATLDQTLHRPMSAHPSPDGPLMPGADAGASAASDGRGDGPGEPDQVAR